MKPGQSCTFESQAYTDDVAGKTVRRITSPDAWCRHPYFYFNMWTPDASRVLVVSNRDDGRWRLYLVEVDTGRAVCLTDDPALRSGMAELSRDGATMLYGTATDLRRLDLRSFRPETLYTQAEPWAGRGVYFSATADHTRAALVQMHAEDVIPAKTGWDTFEAQFRARPRSRLVEVDLVTGTETVLLEQRCHFGHPNYRPDGRTIMFCHEGPWDLVDSRLWFIDPDGTNLREGRKRKPDRPPAKGAERWGHEYWLADSSRAAYEYYPGRDDQGVTSINLLDPDTLDEEVLMTATRFAHFQSNRDNTLIVGDGHPTLSGNIVLVDVPTKTERSVCRHGSSMKPYLDPLTGKPETQMVHPHAAFSGDSRRVVFSSDLHGAPAVYVVTL